jgi:aldehyde dehydrogenase (NAD+)
MTAYQMFIDGEWVESSSGRRFGSMNPWTQQEWATLPQADSDDVDRAVRAARRAFDDGEWARSSYRRAIVLRRFAHLLDENAEPLARCESNDNGKTIREERAMYGAIASYFRQAASIAEAATGRIPEGHNPDLLALTRRIPFGVIGIQTPWNTPGVIMAQAAAPALAAGNAIIVKPSELASCSTLEIAKLAELAGFPRGVFNVVTGFGPEAGGPLCQHPGVDKLVFTGSPEAGVLVATQAAQHLAPVVMELGGKSANVVFADANLDKAVPEVVNAFTASSGQSCMCGSRLIVERSIHDQVIERVLSALGTIKFGDPADPATDVGPVCGPAQIARIEKYVALGIDQGAQLRSGGGRPESIDHPLFYAPTVFTGVKPDMAIAQEEVFGPVLAVMPFDSEDEAVELTNNTAFGLSSAVWTTQLDRAHRVAPRIRAGIVWVNHYRRGDSSFPNGGLGFSGYGRIGGVEGFEEMTQPQSVRFLIEST